MLSYLLFKVASLNCLSVGYIAVGCAVVRARHSGGRQRLRHGLLKLRSLYKLHDNIPSNVLKAFPRVIHDYERKTTLTLHITNTHDALTSVADLNENFVSTHIKFIKIRGYFADL